MTDADYADYLVLPTSMPVQAISLQDRQEQAAGSIGPNENVNKSLCFNKKGAISVLKGKTLKLVDNFTYIGSNISSTETYL